MAHLKIILQLLEEKEMVDDAWDETDLYEASNKKMGYRRYHIDKKMIGSVTNTTTETEGFLYVAMFCVLRFGVFIFLVCYSTFQNTVSSKYSIFQIQYLPNTVYSKILYLTNTVPSKYSIFQNTVSCKYSIFQIQYLPKDACTYTVSSKR